MTVAGKPQYPQDPPGAYRAGRRRHARLPDPLPADGGELLGALGYAGAIVLGPIVPLAVYLTRRRSPFVRWHAAQALNAALTFLLYAVSGVIIGGLLSLDKRSLALLVVGTVAVVYWLLMAWYLVAAARDASRGGFRALPGWMCAALVR